MTLTEALQLDAFDGLTDAQALAYGNVTGVIATDDELWRCVGVAATYGVEAAEGLYAAIAGAGMPAMAETYINPGINLSLDVTQTHLTAIALAVPSLASVCASLKEVGVTHGTRWEGWGVAQPLLADITSTRAAIADRAAKTLLMTSVINAQKDDPEVSFAEFRANIASFEVP